MHWLEKNIMQCRTSEKESSANKQDQEWLQRVGTIRRNAINRVVEKELKRVRRAFMSSAERGISCTAILHARDYHAETFEALVVMGFTVVPYERDEQGRWITYDVSLLLSSANDELSAWRQHVRSVYFTAQQRLCSRQFDSIKKRFEQAARRRQSSITVHHNYCIEVTRNMLEQRLGCECKTTIGIGASYEIYYKLTIE